jgi:pSer/pThr/pTyr-binding forkhead associated (FHA) protein
LVDVEGASMPSLITVSGQKIELVKNKSYVLGRGQGCEIVVSDMACSRRHARITVGGEGRNALFVEDLGSRNGTYVNDARIWDRTAIKDGCLIRIGATIYMLTMDEKETPEEFFDTGTVAIEKLSFGTEIDNEMLRVLRRDGAAPTNFAGKLETFSLIDVLQLLIHNQRSGTLHLSLKDGQGSIEVRQGEVHNASYRDLGGFQALVTMARETAGTFWLVEKTRPCVKVIHEQSHHLLVELCRTLDERVEPV